MVQDSTPTFRLCTVGTTNEEGYYRIESASYGTGTTFLAEPMKSFYLHKSVKFTRTNNSHVTLPNFGLPKKSTPGIVGK